MVNANTIYRLKGWLVLGIDYFKGDPIHIHLDEEGFDRQGWMDGKKKLAAELIPTWTEAVKAKYGMFVSNLWVDEEPPGNDRM